MATYGTTLAQGFSQKVISLFFEQSIAMDISNQDYEGEIKDKLSKLNIMTFGAISLKKYEGSALEADNVVENVGVLETDQQKAYYFKIQSLQRFHSWIKNPDGTLIATLAKTLAQEIDSFVLGFGGDVAAGNRVGTDADDSTTITITATTGAFVVAGGTPVTSAWVGKGIKAVGHTKWYRVKSQSSTTEGFIEDDSDDLTSAYTGGAISGGTSYVVESAAKVQVAYNTFYGKILELKQKLDEAQIPSSDRFLILPPVLANLLLKTSELIPAVPTAYEAVLKGFIGEVAGFKVYMSNQVAGDNTDGYQVLAIHKSWLTFAMGWTESGIEDLIGDFGKAYKGLNIYGAKVVDERRKAGAMGLFYV
jgi:hypothetical protein